MTTEDFKVLKSAIKDFPDNGEWWKSAAEDVFIVKGKTLLEYGFSVEEAKAMLYDLYCAVKDEFGN